ncbi:hypothetical protein O181_084193 [Austropuccinia psidii MF-1]|uniref:Uncharacterized protein n=1 Tax=Austropuccinia psidii MF-1 TaxID=1389203 RepID=A0A9Q3IKD4_9BASI|nr:hypothetical protein [Austropuccinia psidii MF-1]
MNDEPENNKRYIWKKDEKANWEKKIIYKPIDTNGMLYQVLANGSEMIEGPPIHSRKNLFDTYSNPNSPQDIEMEMNSETNNDKYCENSLEDLRNKIIDCFKDEEFIKEYNKKESDQTEEFQIHEISDSLKEIEPRLSLDSRQEANLIEVEVTPLKKLS